MQAAFFLQHVRLPSGERRVIAALGLVEVRLVGDKKARVAKPVADAEARAVVDLARAGPALHGADRADAVERDLRARREGQQPVVFQQNDALRRGTARERGMGGLIGLHGDVRRTGEPGDVGQFVPPSI